MKQGQLEVLIFTDSRFSLKQFCKKYHASTQNEFAKFDSLEEACWNGLFHEMVPILHNKKGTDSKKMVLWKMTKAEHFLELEYSEEPLEKEFVSSINPYLFVRSQSLS